MHVGIVSPEFPPDVGGVETYAVEYVKELARRGHDVTVFTVRHAAGEQSLAGVRIEPVLRLCRSADSRTLGSWKPDIWHPLNAAYAWISEEHPGGIVSVHGNDFMRPYYPIERPDLRRVPFAWRWADDVSRGLRPLWIHQTARRVKQSLARARHIVANSHYTESVLLQRIPGCKGKTSVGFVGVGSHFFDVEWEAGKGGTARLLTVSRLSEARKNVDLVLQALARLKGRHDVQYTIVGDGYDRRRLEGLTRELRLEHCVRFTGFVSREELLDIYAHTDLMILTSAANRDSHEGFGIVYLEAAASGVPSLAARLAGAAEAVEEGTSGMFVEQPSTDAIAEALGRFLGGHVRFRREDCRNFARRFTWARVVDHCLQYYATPR